MTDRRRRRPMTLRTCVDPSGGFVYGVHHPRFTVANLRKNDDIARLGFFDDGRPYDNRANFPAGNLDEPEADTIFEVPNPFPFRGTTYIAKSWADEKARDPSAIRLPEPTPFSFSSTVVQWMGKSTLPPERVEEIFRSLPGPVRLAVAGSSTDPQDLVCLAELSCEFIHDDSGTFPAGLRYRTDEKGDAVPVIHDRMLFEILANNRRLPDTYKKVMALHPGAQGKSEIVGEQDGAVHVFEYLRRNSYIPWGHYAANMAHDAVRYRIRDLSLADMAALRHLYYQRSFIRVADELGVLKPKGRESLSSDGLEDLRRIIVDALSSPVKRRGLNFNRTLWGWNFGFDYAPSGYRLHASHQQVHQQFAMVPATMEAAGRPGQAMSAFACGDLVADFIETYQKQTGRDFFEAYIQAIGQNRRMDEKKDNAGLIVYSDDQVMLFVPKAQTSQWELQLMTVKPVGNILEADTRTRDAIDFAMLLAMRVLEDLGARMMHAIEYSKPLNDPRAGQRLLYAFLPRLPESPGAFSEAQLRWISGHYPEDFAEACRNRRQAVLTGIQEERRMVFP